MTKRSLESDFDVSASSLGMSGGGSGEVGAHSLTDNALASPSLAASDGFPFLASFATECKVYFPLFILTISSYIPKVARPLSASSFRFPRPSSPSFRMSIDAGLIFALC